MAQENTARVITIAATEQPQDIRLRVAAYARVSSSSDEQLNSFAAQNRYYTELISGKDNWQLVDIYADEGITGTSIEKRDDFKRMLRDCERGLIDRILVKSIGQYFTPRELVQVMNALIGENKIVNAVMSNTKIKVLEIKTQNLIQSTAA